MIKAHRHAALADEAMAQGLWMKASEEHFRAASAFVGCLDGSNDENTKRTLRLLHDEHVKQAQDLDRRITRLRQEGKDPSLPQKPLPSPGQSSPFASKSDSGFRDATGPIEESFMLLGQKNELNSSFAQFWKILEGMLDHLSQPVAFATAPLHNTKSEHSPQALHGQVTGSSDQVFDYPPSSSSLKSKGSNELDVNDLDDETKVDMDESWELDSDESFQLVSGTDPRILGESSLRHGSVKEENDELKRQLRQAQSRIADLEKLMKERLAHEHQLRDSIMQAQRAISSSQMLQSITKFPGMEVRQFAMTSSPLRSPQVLDPNQRLGPPSSLRQPDNAPLQSRISELEEKVRLLQVQDITQKAAIAKYKERWDKVKDSMRRKKLAKAAAEVQLAAERNRIDEEVEPE